MYFLYQIAKDMHAIIKKFDMCFGEFDIRINLKEDQY